VIKKGDIFWCQPSRWDITGIYIMVDGAVSGEEFKRAVGKLKIAMLRILVELSGYHGGLSPWVS
jgi:hypothetical protein